MITFTKLKSGDWALKGPTVEFYQGKVVEVRKHSGETQYARVGREIFRKCGESVHLVSEFNCKVEDAQC